AELLGVVRPMSSAVALAGAAERLTALLEGLSTRWLSGSLPVTHARALMTDAIDTEISRLDP
ncbi:TetR family transcriptional regulator C-terminal domain-containing protein, partial [Kitasatospora sp. NPDC058190]|uniref:TetR family transcriptional regulator C-terminal domain-containing protein n=1 Tax=Kitasatospora sp. NPDC058190 TaxID=3346371 RepID=UPI0036D95CB9